HDFAYQRARPLVVPFQPPTSVLRRAAVATFPLGAGRGARIFPPDRLKKKWAMTVELMFRAQYPFPPPPQVHTKRRLSATRSCDRMTHQSSLFSSRVTRAQKPAET